MVLLPGLGVPGELVLQDTFKSALAAFGVLSAAIAMLTQRMHTSTAWRWSSLLWLPLCLCAYALGSMLWSHSYLAAVEAIRWGLLSLLLWVGVNTLTRNSVPTLLAGIHLGAVAASCWTAAQFWADLDWLPQAAVPAATFVNRNFFAEYVVCALPFSVLGLAQMQSARWRLPMALSVALIITAIMMTGTRSALLTLGITTPIWMFVLWRYRQQLAWQQWSCQSRVAVVLVLIGGIVALGMLPSQAPRVLQERTGQTALERSLLRMASVAQPTEYATGSFSVRAAMWRASARMVLDTPWTGVGAGAWEVEIPRYQELDQTLETDYYAHNEYIQLLGEYGVLVGGLFMAILFTHVLHFTRTTWKLPPDTSNAAPIQATILVSLLALFLVSNAGFPWHLACTGMLLILNLSLLAALEADTHASISRIRHRGQWPIRLGLLALALGLLLAGGVSWQAARVEGLLIQTIRLVRLDTAAPPDVAQTDTDWRLHLQSALHINPHYRKLLGEIADPLIAAAQWQDALAVLEPIAASRPHIVAVWRNIALCYAQLNDLTRAQQALAQVRRLQPQALGTAALELILLRHFQQEAQASIMLTTYFDQGRFNQEMTHIGYALGYKTRNWSLAIRSLELGNARWPTQAADGYFRLGTIYADTEAHDEKRALEAFRQGLAAVPINERSNYIRQVPLPYRSEL